MKMFEEDRDFVWVLLFVVLVSVLFVLLAELGSSYMLGIMGTDGLWAGLHGSNVHSISRVDSVRCILPHYGICRNR
jgi:hypothetical protein